MIQGSTETSTLRVTPSTAPHIAARRGWRGFLTLASLLVLVYSLPLYQLVLHSLNHTIHSHILLIPFICAYLVWQNHSQTTPLDRPRSAPFLLLSTVLAISGIASLAFYFLRGVDVSVNDQLSLLIFSFCAFLAASAIAFLSPGVVRTLAFPIAFFFFLTPLPDRCIELMEIASQHASAEVYSWMMNLSGATYFREARTFVLPHLTIIVAQECSGIRSSLVLFLTSLIAGHMFFRTPRNKLILALAVFPLGIVRNAFRIYLLSMASAHWDRSILDSPLHHRGGPIFFALSLVPFFLLLFWLRKKERKLQQT